MSHDRVRSHLRGVAFTTPAPFSADGEELLYDELAANTDAVLDAGGKTFIPCGNTGEYYSLTDDERVGMVETTVETVGDDGIVIGGVAGGTAEAIDLIQRYEAVGADGVMVHDPDHTYIHRKGLVTYYEKLADATDLGIVLYKRGPELSLPVVSELSSVDNVVGMKFAVNDINAFSETVRAVGDELVLTTGIAERFAPAFALEGAEGFTTGIGAFVPEVSLALQEALEREDWERACHLRDLTRPYEDLREEAGPDNDLSSANNVPAIKYGLELAGRYGGPVREPIIELSEADKRRAEQYYDAMVDAEVGIQTSP
jgi:4-hydroxy-tetrahydrodipicolinate synthase